MPAFLVPTPTDREDQYPDPVGVRGLLWQGSLVTTFIQTLIPQQPCADWAWLAVTRGNGGNPTQTALWQVNWHHDPSGNKIIATDTIVVPQFTAVDVCLPVKGPYVTVTTASITGAGSYATGGAWRLGSYPPAQYFAARELIADNTGGTIAAGATLTLTPSFVTNTGCKINVSAQGAATWRASVTVVDGSNQPRQLWLFDTASAEAHADGEFHLPPWPLTLAITNRDAVARSIWSAISLGP